MKERAMWVAMEFQRKKEIPKEPIAGRKWVRSLVGACADAGVTVLYPCVRTHDNAVGWVSKLEPNDFGWDVLEAFIEETSAHQIRIEPWVCLWGDANGLHPEWHARGSTGTVRSAVIGDWMCPARPEVHQYFIDLCLEVLDKYVVDGLHVDYVRYPDQPCFCDFHLSDFRKKTGLDAANLRSPAEIDAWYDYNTETVTSFVAKLSKEVRSRGKTLSAAVIQPPQPITECPKPQEQELVIGYDQRYEGTFDLDKAGYPIHFKHVKVWDDWCKICRFVDTEVCKECTKDYAIFQNWPKWCQKGLLDTVCPMNYRRDLEQYKHAVRKSVEYAYKVPVVSGTALFGIGAEDVANMLRYCEEAKIAGASLFDAMAFVKLDEKERRILADAWLK